MGAHALAVSTSNGWLVAGAGDGAILVAALAAREAAPAANVSIENRGAQRSDSRRSLSGAWGAEPPISIEKLAVADQEYVVSAFGAAVLPEVGDAVRRILS
jgi:hypothetical protein